MNVQARINTRNLERSLAIRRLITSSRLRVSRFRRAAPHACAQSSLSMCMQRIGAATAHDSASWQPNIDSSQAFGQVRCLTMFWLFLLVLQMYSLLIARIPRWTEVQDRAVGNSDDEFGPCNSDGSTLNQYRYWVKQASYSCMQGSSVSQQTNRFSRPRAVVLAGSYWRNLNSHQELGTYEDFGSRSLALVATV